MSEQQLIEKLIEDEGMKFPICEANLLPVWDEYAFVHHNSIEVGSLKYIERAP